MPPEDRTTQLQNWIDRMRSGDESARDELITRSCERLRRLAHRILDGFPNARIRGAETDDVMQEGAIRLMHALKSVPVESVRGFFGLAAKKMRELLIDLTRKTAPPVALGGGQETGTGPRLNAISDTDGPATLAEWTEFHEDVDSLPDQEREMFDLLFYNELSQAEVAELLGVSVRTIKRYWQEARISLNEKRGGERPGH